MKRLILNAGAALTVACALAFAPASVRAETAPAPRTVIHSQSELPTFSYKVRTPTASALLDDDAALLALAEAQRKDVESTLAKYDITDKATLRDLYGAIRDAALIRGDAKAALAASAKVREFADKPSQKLTSGLDADAGAAAMAAGDDPKARKAAFQKAFAQSLEPLPWKVVREDVMAWKAQFETPNMATIMRGLVEAKLDGVVKQSGNLSWDAARLLIRIAANLRRVDPYVAEATAILGAYIAAHKEVKPDIWASRELALDASRALTPTTVAVWDSGVDTALFPGRLYVNTNEKADGKDTDANGFIDDIHGIAYDIKGDAVTELLPVFDRTYPGREAELRGFSLGGADMQAGIDSAAAKAVRGQLAALKPEQMAPLLEASGFYGDYSHGTLVAGVAMASNPAARLMVVRSDEDDYRLKPRVPTRESVTRWASIDKGIVDYMAANGVRVVNMSWIQTADNLERVLEANAVRKNADERRKIALELLTAEEQSLTAAFRDAPQILFVAAAGNSNADIGFAGAIPADIALPNVLTVGAVDQAGDEASFTSYGERVRVYANGFQVESVLPGGSKTRVSGTSLAAPQVTNLAAKLFALNPKLTPTEVIKLILDGATKSADGKRLLIDPKASGALLKVKP